jgi:hypothetical protein
MQITNICYHYLFYITIIIDIAFLRRIVPIIQSSIGITSILQSQELEIASLSFRDEEEQAPVTS